MAITVHRPSMCVTHVLPHLPVLLLHCTDLPRLHRPDEQAEVGVGEVNRSVA
jgi:hypothetical protein